MDTINKVIMSGRITRDPDFKMIQNKWAKADMTIATNFSYKTKNGQKDETCYLDFALWGEAAEQARDNLSKGSPITVEGRLKLESWQNAAGETRRKHVMHVDNIQYMETLPRENKVPEPKAEEQLVNSEQLDELPF